MNEETKLTNKQYIKLFNVSKPTATRDLTRLVKKFNKRSWKRT
ncbi:hypothetical protein KKG58_04155 [Patescibacteria group bacterium]|nr:hypothetical protein [Patescibacteria group bacterium]